MSSEWEHRAIAGHLCEAYPAVSDCWARWLPDAELTIRTATKPKSIRIRLADDSPFDVYFTDKGLAKSTVTLQHRNLPDSGAAEAMKAHWAEGLDTLKQVLEDAG